jgi:hypothetical protein
MIKTRSDRLPSVSNRKNRKSSAFRFQSVFLTIALFVSLPFAAPACGWWEDPESFRMACFYGVTGEMQAFEPFFYSPHLLNTFIPDREKNDQMQVAEEWNQQLGGNIVIDHIRKIVFATDPEEFIQAWKFGKLPRLFSDNQFIATLVQPQNKAYLDYLAFAKLNERCQYLNSDPWEGVGDPQVNDKAMLMTTIERQAREKLNSNLNPFLKSRYAYHLVRLGHTAGKYGDAILDYEKFLNPVEVKSMPEAWAILHYALSMDNMGRYAEAQYGYSRAFDLSDEKKVRAYQGFGIDNLSAALSRCKNNHEKSVVTAMAALKNPAPALTQLESMYKLDPGTVYAEVLIMREINKLEDWIFTPSLTPNQSSISNNYWLEEGEIKQYNKLKDIKYLVKLRSRLEGWYKIAAGKHKDFLALAIAHLWLMDDKPVNANGWLKKMSTLTDIGLIRQKQITDVMVKIYLTNGSDGLGDEIAKELMAMEKEAIQNPPMSKAIFTITRKYAKRMEEMNFIAEAGLLMLKSEGYKNDFDNAFTERDEHSYYSIAWLDGHAKPADIDKVIAILRKPGATPFQEYLRKGTPHSIAQLTDLKGVIAFRNRDMKLAKETFAKVPVAYYQDWGAMNEYLNEDPFIPKSWPHQRSYTYRFSREQFVTELIQWEERAKGMDEPACEAAWKAGAAWYNCSWFGNAWMMWSYGWSRSGIYYGYDHYLFGPDRSQWNDFGDEYYGCSRAKPYFQKVFSQSTNRELKAKAAFMLYQCETHRVEWKGYADIYGGLKTDKFAPYDPQYLRAFYTDLKDTQTWSAIHCDLLEDRFHNGY